MSENKSDAEISTKRASSIMLHICELSVYGYPYPSLSQIKQGLQEGVSWLPCSEKI